MPAGVVLVSGYSQRTRLALGRNRVVSYISGDFLQLIEGQPAAGLVLEHQCNSIAYYKDKGQCVCVCVGRYLFGGGSLYHAKGKRGPE